MNGYMLQKSKHLHRTVERHGDVTCVIGADAFRKQLQITKENKDVCLEITEDIQNSRIKRS